MNSDKFSALELMQAMQLGHAAAALHTLGVMDAMAEPHEALQLAQQFELDPVILQGLLDHLSRTTSFVVRRGKHYRRTKAWDDGARFVVGLYGASFGQLAAGVVDILRRPETASRLIDRMRHADAFDNVETLEENTLPLLVAQLGLLTILDVGCGAGQLLVRLAKEQSSFRGWGLESNPRMRALANAHAKAAQVGRRVKILAGDGRKLVEHVDEAISAKLQAVVAVQFVNEMFGQGDQEATNWLTTLRNHLPGRILIISDYYGRLGSRIHESRRLTLVHDHAQLLSGQGVPPSTRAQWMKIYRKAGVRLIHAIEDVSSTRYIHLLAL